MTNLATDNSIVINKADKGTAVLIQNRSDYEEKVRQYCILTWPENSKDSIEISPKFEKRGSRIIYGPCTTSTRRQRQKASLKTPAREFTLQVGEEESCTISRKFISLKHLSDQSSRRFRLTITGWPST